MLDHLSIRTKLIASFAILLSLTLALGLFAINRVGAVRSVAVDLETNWMPSINQLGVINTASAEHRFNLAMHVLNTDEGQMRRIDQRLADLSKRATDASAAYQTLISSPEERRLYDNFARLAEIYASETQALLALSRSRETPAATARLQQHLNPAYRDMRAAVDRLTVLNVEGGAAAGRTGGQAYDLTLILVLGLLAGAVLLGATLGWTIVRGIGRGIASVVTPMRAMTAGDLSAEVPALAERTELGTIAVSLRAFREVLLAKRAADAAADAEAAIKAQRAARLDGLTRDFEAEAAEVLRAVAAAATELNATAAAMQGTAADGNERATSLAAASEEASANVQAVAASAEEMAASIAEVARQVNESARVARQATEDARVTDAAVGGLSDAVGRIGEVVRLISGIAGQTNLLALNATIEAARAGEHGKGFAVVASEVKALASQTAKATEEIGTQIATIQAETGRAVEAIRSIGETIASLDGLTTQVAAAAEQQAAATREIGRAVSEAAAGTRDVSRNAGGVTLVAQQTGDAAAQVQAASGELSRKAEGLRAQVDCFLAGVRAA